VRLFIFILFLLAAPAAFSEQVLEAPDRLSFERALSGLGALDRVRTLSLLSTPLQAWEEMDRLSESVFEAPGRLNPRLRAWILEPASRSEKAANQRFVTLSNDPRPVRLLIERSPCIEPLKPVDRCGRQVSASIAVAVQGLETYRTVAVAQGSPEALVEGFEGKGWQELRRRVWARLEILKTDSLNKVDLEKRLYMVHRLPALRRSEWRERQLMAARLFSESTVRASLD